MSTEPESPPEQPAGLLAAAGTLAPIFSADVKPKMVQHTIDGICYTSVKLPAMLGLEVWTKLAAIVGDAVVKAVASGSLADMDAAELLALVARAASKEGLGPVLLDLFSHTKVGAIAGNPKEQGALTPETFDKHFAGEYLHMLKAVAFVIRHNLAGPTFGAR